MKASAKFVDGVWRYQRLHGGHWMSLGWPGKVLHERPRSSRNFGSRTCLSACATSPFPQLGSRGSSPRREPLDSYQLKAGYSRSTAFVAAWLPGSEGRGIAEVLFGAYGFKGKLGFSWPRTADQVPTNIGDPDYDPLFEHGFGLTY